MHRCNRIPAIALLCVIVSAGAFAQSQNITTGGITGVVADASGTGLPGVTVTAVNNDTGLRRNDLTQVDGAYVLSLLPPGNYRVEAELEGLGKSVASNVTVLLGNTTKADLKLTPQVSEQITVTAEAPVIDVARSGTAMSITQQQMSALPILTRDFRALAQASSGVVEAFGGRITANGARGIATDYNVDGANSNNDFFGEQTGGTRAPFTFSQAAIKEFQIIRSQYNAEYGRGVGGTLNAITRSGTNSTSGEIFTYYRKRDWAGTRAQFINGQTVQESFKAKDSTQPGFSVGGPIMRDRLFYFANADFQRQKLPIVPTDVRTVPAFIALPEATKTAFYQKIESVTGIPFDQEVAGYDQTFDQNTYLLKFDANLGSKNHVSLRDNYSDFQNTNNQNNFNLLSNQGVEHNKFNQIVAQGETILTSSLLNQALVQHTKDERPITPTTSGIPELQITYSGSTRMFLGPNDFLPNNTAVDKWQLKDTVSWLHGTHTFKAGAEALLMNIDNLFPRNRAGVYQYASVADFVADKPSTFLQGYGAGGGLTTWDQNTYGVYVSDEFRPFARMTLDLGLRYDYQTMPTPERNVYPQHPEFITDIEEDRDNIAPRFGFAYDVTGSGRSVLRGGTGLFYNYLPSILLSNPLTQISGNFAQATLTCSRDACPTFPNILTPEQHANYTRLGSDVVIISPDFQAMEAWRSSLQYEQQLGTGYSAAAGVIYSKMTNVQGSRNINAVRQPYTFGNLPVYNTFKPTGTPDTRPYTDLNNVRQLFSDEEANYTALTLETHKLAVNNAKLSWDVSYTYSRSIDQDTNERSTSSSFLYDPFDPSLSEGLSDNDVPHRVVLGGIYRLPWGFQVSGIASWRSGIPYTRGLAWSGGGISTNGLPQITGNVPVFVNGNGEVIDLTQASGMTRPQFAEFLAANNAVLDDRNGERQPSVYNVDFRLAKTFALLRGIDLQVLAEVFNALNTKNKYVTGTNQNLFTASYSSSTDKMTITKNAFYGTANGYVSSIDPRQIQVGVKVTF